MANQTFNLGGTWYPPVAELTTAQLHKILRSITSRAYVSGLTVAQVQARCPQLGSAEAQALIDALVANDA